MFVPSGAVVTRLHPRDLGDVVLVSYHVIQVPAGVLIGSYNAVLVDDVATTMGAVPFAVPPNPDAWTYFAIFEITEPIFPSP